MDAIDASSTRGVFGKLRAASYERHPLHHDDTVWSNTNCYIDVWIEVLASLGLDPAPALGSALRGSFIGDQWEFLKIHAEDLEELHGIRVGEYDIWRPLLDHLRFQLDAGNLLIIEADGYFLPDTAGTSYRVQRVKTAIAPTSFDAEARTMTYFHNEGLHELSGDDFDGIFGPEAEHGLVPRPYVELVRLDRLGALGADELRANAWKVFHRHLARIGDGNPIAELCAFIEGQRAALAANGDEFYHSFCFATTRQAGLTAMLAAAYCRWLSAEAENSEAAALLSEAAEAFEQTSVASKKLQFQLARVAGGRTPDLTPVMQLMTDQWARGIDCTRRAGRRV